jgi:hypothetical protein
MVVALQVIQSQPAPEVCRDCRYGECRYRTMRVRSYIIAYREALKAGDDPAEYIRDRIKPSRRVGEDEHRTPTEALIRGTKPVDRHWHIDIKVSLEQARDVGGLQLEAWNAPAVAAWFCSRASEVRSE